MLESQRIPLGQWLPDRPAYPNRGANEIRNCIPQAESYRSLNGFAANSNTIGSSETILNAIWTIQLTTNFVEIIAGSATRLLRLNGVSWLTVGSGYSVTAWEFTRFGNFVYAAAPGLQLQSIDLTAGSPSFSAVSGAPNARRIGVVRDFVMVGDLDSAPSTIQWSGYNNPTIWDATGDVPTQAGLQTLDSGGRVQKIVGGPFGYVFQQFEIRALEYIGPKPIFNIQSIDRARGAVSGDAVVQAGDRVFFYAQDGFFMLQGQTFTPIGQERVNQWFLGEVAPLEAEKMVGAVDRRNRLVFWGFRTTQGSGEFDRLLIYNYSVDRWAYADIAGLGINNLFELRIVGYSLDQLDTVLPGGIDLDSILVDSTQYAGGNVLLFAANTAGALGTFDGAPLTAVMDTAEFDAAQNHRRAINGVRPIVEGSSASVQVALGRRDLLTASPTYTTNEPLNSVGEAPLLSDSRYHRIRLTVEGGFDHASAADVQSRRSGRF